MHLLRSHLAIIILVAIAVSALVGIGINGLVIESETFRPINSSEPPVKVDAPYVRESQLPQEVTVTLFYRGYGNTALRLTPLHCFDKNVLQVNGKEVVFQVAEKCDEFIIDLKEWLQPGSNTVMAQVNHGWSDAVGLVAGSPLVGWNLPQSFFTIIFISSLLALMWLFLAKQGYSPLTCFIFTIGCALYFESLHTIHHFDHAQDLEWHSIYIQYLSEHFFSPSDYNSFNGVERPHPPTYYWLCALVAKGLEFIGTFDVWTGIRFLSLGCYVVFVYFGMRVMTLFLSGNAFYISLSLLLFWPAGMINATRINNDVMLYPLWTGCFYYTLAWYRNGKIPDLTKALIYCGLGFMAKNSALVPTSILGVTVLLRLGTRHINWSDILNKKTLPGWATIAVCLLYNAIRTFAMSQRTWDHTFSYLQFLHPWHGGYKMHLQDILSPDVLYLFYHPFFTETDPVIWRCHIAALLFNNTQWWPHPQLASCLLALYLLILAYMAVFTITLLKNKLWRLFPLTAGLMLPFIASYMFLLVAGQHADTDIHYIWPVIVPIITVFMLAVQEAKVKGRPVLYYAGNATALFFIVTGIIFIQWQWI